MTTRQHRRRLCQLADAAVVISAASSPRELLRAIAEEGRRLIGAEQALVRMSFREHQPLSVFVGVRADGFNLERDGASLTALAGNSRQPLRLSGKGLKSKGVDAGLRGWMSAPLLARDGRRVGAIQLANKRHGQFTAEDESLLLQLARIAGIAAAIERKRVEDEVRARLRQQAAVVDLGERALKGMEPGELMDHAVALVAQTLEVEYCKVLELLPDGKEMLLRAGTGWKPGYVGRKKIDAGLGSHAGFTLVSSEPVIIEDLRTEMRFAEPLLHEHGVVSGISVIIEGGGLPYGVLGAHTTTPRRFTHDDVNFLQAVANVLAITLQRSRADQALRQSEQRFRQAQRAANLGAYDWNVTTGAMKWSEELPALKGIPAATFAAWMEGVLAEDRSRVLKTLEEAVAQGSDFELEFRMMAPVGVIWVATRGQVFSLGGRPAHVLGVVLDITSRVRAEELLRRSEKLAVVGRLAATIAHEINNPLESVTNLLYLLEHHPTLDESARRYASLAQQELHRVAHIARQTLSFHRESTTAVPVKLSELLDNVLQMHARRIAAADISVERRYDFDPLVKVFPGEMQQVFSNLVLNALEAMGSKGRLLVRVSAGVEWGPARRQGVRVVVADTGNGIPRALRQQIFEPFFTTKGERGTGLGLWVTNGIVQKHGGSIRLRSSTKPGRSFTCFSIFLPAERATARFARRQREAAAVHPGQLAA